MKSIYFGLFTIFAFVIACGNPPNNEKKTLLGQQNVNPTVAPTNTPGGTTGTTTSGGTTSGGGTTGTTTGTTTSPNGLTYTKDVKPIMSQYGCEGCHSKYNNYSGVKNSISSIMGRVANDSMPQGPNKLTADKKKILADWAATPGMPN